MGVFDSMWAWWQGQPAPGAPESPFQPAQPDPIEQQRLALQRAAGVLPQDRPEMQADGSGHYRQDSDYLGASQQGLDYARDGTFGGGLISWPFEAARGQGKDGTIGERWNKTLEAFSPVRAAEETAHAAGRQSQHFGHVTGLSDAGPTYDFSDDEGKMAAMMDTFGIAGMLPVGSAIANKVGGHTPFSGGKQRQDFTSYEGVPHDELAGYLRPPMQDEWIGSTIWGQESMPGTYKMAVQPRDIISDGVEIIRDKPLIPEPGQDKSVGWDGSTLYSGNDDPRVAALIGAINQGTLDNFDRASTHPRDLGADGRDVLGSPRATHGPSMDNEALGWWREVGNDVVDARTGESVYDPDTAENFNAIQGGKSPRAAIEGFNEHDAYTLNKGMMDFMEAGSPRREFLHANKDEAAIPGIIVGAGEKKQQAAGEAPFQPIRAYHGTTHEIDGPMRPHPGARGDAVYFNTSPQAASSYAGAGGDPGNYARFAPEGDHPSVLPADITGRVFDENAMSSPDERRAIAEAYNEQLRARAAEKGRDVYPDELMDPDEFASTWFDRAYQPKGYNVLQSLSYDGNEQNALLGALGYHGRMGLAVGRSGGADVAMFKPGTVKSATTGETLFSGKDEAAIPGVVMSNMGERTAASLSDQMPPARLPQGMLDRGAIGDQSPDVQARQLQWQMPRQEKPDVASPFAPANANESTGSAAMINDIDALTREFRADEPTRVNQPPPGTASIWKTPKDAVRAQDPILQELQYGYGATLMDSSQGIFARRHDIAYPHPAETYRMINTVADGIRRAKPPKTYHGFGYQLTDKPNTVQWMTGADGDTLMVGTKATAADVEQAVRSKVGPDGRWKHGVDDPGYTPGGGLYANKDETALPGVIMSNMGEQSPFQPDPAAALGHLPNTYYHSTTKSFPPRKGFADPTDPSGPYEAESHHGRAIYMSSDRDDSVHNYSHVNGPDLKNRIGRRAEQLEHEVSSWSPQKRAALERAAKKIEGEIDGSDYYLKGGDMRLAYAAAYKELAGGENRVMELRTNPRNPVKIGGNDQTVFDYDYNAGMKVERIEKPDGEEAFVVKDRDGDVMEEFADEGSAYDYMDESAAYREPEGSAAKIIEMINQMSNGGDAFHELMDQVRERAMEGGLLASDLEKLVRESDAAAYLIDENSNPGQFLQEIYRSLGHDAAILRDPHRTFENMGIAPGAEHVALFDNRRVRLTNAKFDPKKVDSTDLLSANPSTASILALLASLKEDRRE